MSFLSRGTRAAVSDLSPQGPEGTSSSEAQSVAQSWEDKPLQMGCKSASPGASCGPPPRVSALSRAVPLLTSDP